MMLRGGLLTAVIVVHPTENRYKRTIFDKAYFLDHGEVIETKFWIDKGDEIGIQPAYYECLLACSTKGKGWRNTYFDGVFGRPGFRIFQAESPGYLKIKARERYIIYRIVIVHNKSWYLDLKTGQVKKIKVYPGDILCSSSDSRYYLDDQLLEGSYVHTHVQDEERYLNFKGSINPSPIKIRVVHRRGY